MKFLAATIALALFPFTVAHSQQIFACDLIEPAVASVILGSELSRHIPQRDKQKLDDKFNYGATLSNCLFWARKDREYLRVMLMEYSSAKVAEKAFIAGDVKIEDTKIEKISGLGDMARFSSLGREAHSIIVRKGERILILETRWKDISTQAGVNERLKAAAITALRKL